MLRDGLMIPFSRDWLITRETICRLIRLLLSIRRLRRQLFLLMLLHLSSKSLKSATRTFPRRFRPYRPSIKPTFLHPMFTCVFSKLKTLWMLQLLQLLRILLNLPPTTINVLNDSVPTFPAYCNYLADRICFSTINTLILYIFFQFKTIPVLFLTDK